MTCTTESQLARESSVGTRVSKVSIISMKGGQVIREILSIEQGKQQNMRLLL